MDDLYIDRLCRCLYPYLLLCFFFNDTAPPELYTLSLHDALPISVFGSAWSGLELPRHLSHFTPASLARTVQQAGRSEEHTSELQSPDHLVCRLLLEKKKKIISLQCEFGTSTPLAWAISVVLLLRR